MNEMGEIRVRVRLVNTTDADLAARGQLPVDQVRTYDADALVDTGAVYPAIPVSIQQVLGVTIRGQRMIMLADGRRDTVDFTAPIRFEIMGRDADENALVLGDEVLIGQVLLEKLDLLADCANQRLVPNPAHPNQPVFRV